MRALALLLVSACWSTPAPTPIQQTAPTSPALPAPSVAWKDQHLVTRLLPAISTDGSVIVLGVEDADGARGNPNLRIEVRDRKDQITATHEVLGVGDVDSGAFVDENGPLPPLNDRVTAANELLSKLHARHRLVPLKKMALERTTDDAPLEEQVAHGGDFTVAWKANHVIVTDDAKRATLVDRAAPASWLAPPSKSNTHACENDAYLFTTWAAPEHRLVLVTINYSGTDMCWEPDAQLHVLTW